MEVSTQKIRQLTTRSFEALLVYLAVLGFSSYLVPHWSSSQAHVQSVILQLILVLGLPLLVSKLLNLKLSLVFKLRPTSFRNLLLTLVLTLCLIFLLDEITYLQNVLIKDSNNLSHEIYRLLRIDSFSRLIPVLLSMAIIPGVCEEVLFRGYILDRLLGKDNQWQSIMMSSMLFGLFHQNLPRLLPTALSGILLAFIAIRTGSLYNAIACHILVNAWAIAIANSALPAHLPWLSHPRHVPLVLQGICLAGVFFAGKLLKPAKVESKKQTIFEDISRSIPTA